MLDKPHILSLFLNSFNKSKKNISSHARSSMFIVLMITIRSDFSNVVLCSEESLLMGNKDGNGTLI